MVECTCDGSPLSSESLSRLKSALFGSAKVATSCTWNVHILHSKMTSPSYYFTPLFQDTKQYLVWVR